MVFSEGGETLKKRRHTEILSIIAEYEVENQEMLQLLLKERGYNVTQATISRDIKTRQSNTRYPPFAQLAFAIPEQLSQRFVR